MNFKQLIDVINQIDNQSRNNVVSTNPYHSRVVTRSNPYNSNHIRGKKRAFVCIKTTSGRFLVVRHNVKNKWMLPGGLCDHNEDYRTTAIRETREEWGGNLNNIRHLYTTQDNAAIFLSTYNFRNTTHDQRVNIFRSRTTPHETSDYGFYNPRTRMVESYSGVNKPNQNFLGVALNTINNVVYNY